VASQTDIYNLAFTHVEEEATVGPDDTAPRVALFDRVWETTRDGVLAAHPWNEAVRWRSIAKLSAAPAGKWTNKFLYPADCLRILTTYPNTLVWAVGSEVDDSGQAQKVIFSDADSPLVVQHIFRLTDPNLYSPGLVRCLALKLAHTCALKLGGSRTLKDSLFEQYKVELSEARSSDGQEGVPDEPLTDDIFTARGD
jgi:hypothetical protein